MKTHDDIVKKYLGKFEKEKGMKTSECVAWAKLYNKEVFGQPYRPFHGTAYNCWVHDDSFPKDKYDRIEYKKGMFPPVGATVFWNEKYNPGAGHVAIAHHGSDHDTLVTVSQNSAGRAGDAPGDEIMVKEYGYFGVCGWYVYKGSLGADNTSNTPIISGNLHPIDKLWLELGDNCEHFWKDYSDTAILTGGQLRKMQDIFAHNLKKKLGL